MAMKLVVTAVADKTVRMRLADDPDPAKATAWLDFQLPISAMKHPGNDAPLTEVSLQLLSEVQLAALRCARDAIVAQSQGLQKLIAESRR